MTKLEEKMTEIEKKQSFWKGFVLGVVCTFATIAAVITAGYYFLEIVEKLSK